ncbi:hypothetical protein KP509_30G062200 [Ceratopteris richardii]|uniref:Uncharacterized protein n=1 Tax=Ceratopteris richardii TaxID=49495 RepID=A0A8T2R4N0_CERRI|nr:hypothetical protein KP509_30G062200 [Ceratopteris richardii]
MLQLIASVIKCGIHGQVVSSLTGSPLAASISVKGINFTVFATEEYGDYHRLLSPGQAYEVSASMAGYHRQTASIFVHEGKSSRLDFSLEPSDPHPNVVQSRNNSADSSMKDIHQEEKNTTAHEVQKRLYKESLRTEFFLGKGQLKVAYDKLVTVPLLADFCLMLAVLLLCILFVCRYRARSLRS